VDWQKDRERLELKDTCDKAFEYGKNPTNFLHIHIGGDRLPLLLPHYYCLYLKISFIVFFVLPHASCGEIIASGVLKLCRAIPYETPSCSIPNQNRK
jgi:hypothetical protein